MKILFFTDNFPPEYNAPATRTYEHCKAWVRQGIEVTVITCNPNFPSGKIYKGYKNRLYKKEEIDGIKVVRVWSYITSNTGFYKRTLDFVSYAVSAFFASLFIKTDIIVATSPQFFTALSGRLSAFFKRKKWIMEVRDLWPESITAVNAMKSPKIIRFLEIIELYLYRSASSIVVVTDSFKENLTSRGIIPEKIFVIKNGVDTSLFSYRPKDVTIANKFSLNGNIVVGYIGTHGLAHSLPFIIKAIHQVNRESVHFLFVGDGAVKNEIVGLSKELEIDNITFLEPIDKNKIAQYLSIIDIALVPLRKSETFKSVIPSKIFESSAMRKPILLGVEGESKELINSYQAGESYEPENIESFISQLDVIINKYKKGYYEKGSEKLAKDFDRNKLALDMLKVIEKTSIDN